MSVLKHKKIVLLRAEKDALYEALLAEGAEVLFCPVIKPTFYCDKAEEIQTTLTDYDAIAFSSRNGVRFFKDYLDTYDLTLSSEVQFAAIGEGTAEEIKKIFHKTATGALTGKHVLLPQALKALPTYGEKLEALGFKLTRFVVYKTDIQKIPPLPTSVDAVVFTSPSTVYGLLENGGWPTVAKLFCMGPSTRKALEDADFFVHAEAKVQSVLGLVEILKEKL